MHNLIWGIVYGLLGQILSFMQLQASIKYGWNEKYLWLIMLFGVPSVWIYMQSVNNLINAFNGSIWESRILGFSIGVIVFAIMGWMLFGETISIKTGISLLLALGIVLIQIFWKS
jgi:multidrug transporter EmrE-like cation transporter